MSTISTNLMIEEILRTAKEAGASDVHLTVGVSPKMRVNGKLITMDYPAMTPANTLDVLLSIMSELQRERFEERGEYDMSFSIPNCGRYRVNVHKQRGSVAYAFRLVGDEITKAEELGLPDSVVELYRKKRGLVLVSGPAGSGKTTTLAAIVDKINNHREAHVLTLEDPIEYLHPHKLSMITQREIGLDTENYVSALRAALREDSDVILVGEICDFETLREAVAVAETGHLVLSTLHTFGAASTVERVIEMCPLEQQQRMRVQLSKVLEAVISQQLIPTADGKGRVAAFEVMHTDSAVRNLIQEGELEQLSDVMREKHDSGMITMDEAICQLYCDGRISRECAIQFAQNPDEMENQI